MKKDTQRRREEAEKNFNRGVEDLAKNYQRRREELQRELTEEIEAVREATDAWVAVTLNGVNRVFQGITIARQAAVASIASISFDTPPGARGNRGVLIPSGGGGGGNDPNTPLPYARGGPVFANKPVIVGDPDPSRPNQPNPELFVPQSNGMIIPLSRFMFSPPSSHAGVSQVFDNRRSVDANISTADLDKLGPVAVQTMKNLIGEVLQDALR